MKFALTILPLIAATQALQLPFEIPYLNDEFKAMVIEEDTFNGLSFQDSMNLHKEWIRNELKFGKTKLMKYFLNFKKSFAKPKTNLNYKLKQLDSTPELLGFDSVKQISGYFSIEETEKEFFYWFFESRNDPINDPLILWLSGGPGCSSNIGLAMELGPSMINATIQPDFNPYAWNSNASLLFLDQPASVGFSTVGDQSEIPFTTEQASIDFVNFVKLFRAKYPQYAKLDFHIAGESYAGHYIPKYAASVVDANLPLKSVLIGNGITDAVVQAKETANMGCGKGGIGKIYTDEECSSYDANYERFLPYGLLCYAHPNPLTCFLSALASPNVPDSGDRNPYDSRIKCGDSPLCYEQMNYIDEYFNLPSTQKALGVQKHFTPCDRDVGLHFTSNFDVMRPYQQYVTQLLEKQIPVLIYAGDKDLVCDWLGNLAWVNVLDYEDHDQFNKTEFIPWITLNGTEAGEVKNYKHFTFLRVYESGHMVPMDQPHNALDMVNRWINGDFSFQKKLN
ncbi:uncharacterized protein KGF55_001012 [Candida pseudojiufengensis]|uniref:uncharacterized protein n=1 Tax=Candida pseudojiufengensis TaxID=497109 RepID=UPI0022243077|nr:uncharacterized protein KGF55_001012 [Candida pseudojiufengensis]KAI5965650.1 hypothetical protein KGF55_001012 [Candida pseudojiufengensis]